MSLLGDKARRVDKMALTHPRARRERNVFAEELEKLQGLAAIGLPTSLPVAILPPPPEGAGLYFRLAGETFDAPLWEGADLLLYSDSGVTLKGSWDSAIGRLIPGDQENILIGAETGGPLLGSAVDNVIIGDQAGRSLNTGFQNVFIGSRAGDQADNDAANVYVGFEAGEKGWAGQGNTLVGYQAGGGGASITVRGWHNAFFGYQAGRNVTTARRNTCIGKFAGNTLTSGESNVLIGYHAGQLLSTQSNQLHIGNKTTSSTPLIYGEFDNLLLRFEAVVFMKEKAEALADQAGYGQVWVKDLTPNELWFTDDSGVDYQVAFTSGPVVGASDALTVGDAATVAIV